MPILDLELVCATEAGDLSGLARTLAEEAASVLHSRPGSTWVKIHVLPSDRYAENGPPLAADELPVFVKVLQREPPQGAPLEAEVAALTDTIARVLNRPCERVHLEYLAPAAGRQSFGGRLVK